MFSISVINLPRNLSKQLQSAIAMVATVHVDGGMAQISSALKVDIPGNN
jgi:hypothetical protein